MHRPIWNEYNKKHLNDNMHHNEFMKPWPGYIKNSQYPFGYNNVFIDSSSEQTNSNQWCSTDSEIAFKENLQSAPQDWKYRSKVVRYTCNSHGYRTDDWDNINWKESIVLFGDSCTFGVGTSDDETINYFLEKFTGRQVVNLGVPGGSNGLMLNLSTDLIENFGVPYAVIMNWSTTDRFRFYHSSGYHDAGPWDGVCASRIDSTNVTNLWKLTYANPYHEMCTNYYTGKISRHLWEDKTKYISISYFSDTAHFIRVERQFAIDNGARDRIHPGSGNSLEVANYIFNRLKEL